MKTLLFMVTLLAMATAALGMEPPGVEWERTYFPDDVSRFLDICETFDDGYAVACLKLQEYGYPPDTSILKFNEYGDLLWAASLDCYHQVMNTVIELPDSNLIAAGSVKLTSSSTNDLAICCFSSDGQDIWWKNYDLNGSSENANSVVLLPDGGFAICGEISPAEGMNQAWILRTDSQGDTLWTREWGEEFQDRAKQILYIDGGLTVLMHGTREVSSNFGPYVVRYDLDGNMLWETAVEFPGSGPAPYAQAMCEASNDGLLIMDNYTPLIIHSDYYGNTQWYFSPPGLGQDYGWSIDTTMDGGIIFGGENRSDEIWDASGMISRHNADGTEMWRDYVYESGCLCIYSVHQLSQGGYIAAGYANPSSTDSYQGFLMKYSPEMGIGEPVDTELNLEVSPNPFSSLLSVHFTLPEAGNASVCIYDLSGRLVSTVTEGLFPEGNNSVEWDVPEDLSSGCYFVQYNSEMGSRNESVALIK